MDPSELPSADELGVTEIEYERIIRGLREREQKGLMAPADARHLVEQDGLIAYKGSVEQRFDEVAGARPRSGLVTPQWWHWFAPLAVVVLVVLVFQHSGASSGGPGYAFLHTDQGHPVTQSSCKPLPVAIYPAGGPSDGEALVREAVGILSAATGLDIRVTGVFGGSSPGWNFESAPRLADDPVGVSWQDGDAIAELNGDVAGIGGSLVETSPRGTKYLVSGTIALSRDYFAHADRADQLAVVLHEFGHVLGLDHVGSRQDVMYPSVNATKLGPGDLEGLRLAGHGPCV